MIRWLLPVGIDPEASLLPTARGLCAIGDGYMAVLLPAYLLAIGLETLQVGIFRRRGDAPSGWPPQAQCHAIDGGPLVQPRCRRRLTGSPATGHGDGC